MNRIFHTAELLSSAEVRLTCVGTSDVLDSMSDSGRADLFSICDLADTYEASCHAGAKGGNSA